MTSPRIVPPEHLGRRTFIKTLLGATGTLLLPTGFSRTAEAAHAAKKLPEGLLKVTLLHTNDVHSHIFPHEAGRNKGMGGAASRKTLVKKIRKKYPHVALLDAGDMFQGTPYYNFFGGELELKVMSEVGYDIAILGNHDFDKGVDGLEAVIGNASFPFTMCNYSFESKIINEHLVPYVVKEYDWVRVGFFGIGLDPATMIADKHRKGLTFTDGFAAAKKTVEQLRMKEGCHAVVALTHLGLWDGVGTFTDVEIAHKVPGIDVIIGGHSHTFLRSPEFVSHKSGWRTAIMQAGWGGIWLGKVDLWFVDDKLAALETDPTEVDSTLVAQSTLDCLPPGLALA